MRYPLWEFPSWVPGVVADYARELIEGPSGDFAGCRPIAGKLAENLKRLKARLAEIDGRLRKPTNLDAGEIRRLQEQKRWAWARRKELQEKLEDLDASVDFLKRLTTDDGMKECYTRLLSGFTDSQWRDFLCAAWMARCDFAGLRTHLKEAARLQTEIARIAEELRNKVQWLYELETELPADIILASALLRRASRIVRGDDAAASFDGKTVLVTHLLQALAEAAGEWKPQPVAAREAMKWRKASPRAEYTRTFAEALVEKGFELTPSLMSAMAFVVTVAINDPNAIAIYDDVRKALQKKDP